MSGTARTADMLCPRKETTMKPWIIALPLVLAACGDKDVVDALKKVSDQDFGFNAEQWKNWYIKTHTHHDIQVRR